MKNILIASLLVVGLFSNSSAQMSPSLASATTSYQIEWPNYNAPPWTNLGDKPYVVEVSVPVENNPYVFGPAKYGILIGSASAFTDSMLFQSVLISEISILDSGPILRSMQVRIDGFMTVVSLQIKIKGKWKEVPSNYRFSIEIVDHLKVIKQGELKSVIIRFSEGRTERIKVEIENKPPPGNKPEPKK